MVGEICNRDVLRERRVAERCGIRLLCCIQSRAADLIALTGWRVRRQIRRDDVQQNAREPRVREVRRDPRAHRSCSQYHGFFNATFHGTPSKRDSDGRTGYKTVKQGSNRCAILRNGPKIEMWRKRQEPQALSAGFERPRTNFVRLLTPRRANRGSARASAWLSPAALLAVLRTSESSAYCAKQKSPSTASQAQAWAH